MLSLIFLMHAMFAAIFPIGRMAVQVSSPIFFTAVRMIVAGCIFFFYELIRYRKTDTIPLFTTFLIPLGLISLFNIYLTNIPEMWAMQFLPAAKAAFLYSISPFCAALFSYFFFGDKMTVKKLLGMGIGVCGFMIMIVHTAPQEMVLGGIGVFSWGELAIVLAAIATALGWVLMRSLMRTTTVSGWSINAWSMIMGGLMALGTSYLLESWDPIPVTDVKPFLFYLSLAIICSNLFGYMLYPYLLKYYTNTLLSFVGFIEPLMAAFYGWLFIGESVAWQFFAASLIVFVGLYIFYQQELSQGYILKPNQRS